MNDKHDKDFYTESEDETEFGLDETEFGFDDEAQFQLDKEADINARLTKRRIQ